MIQDIIELPTRETYGEFDTTVPRFYDAGGIDDIAWYGRSVDLALLSQLFKYKIIESVGTNAIERVFMTNEPIDFKSKWVTAQIPIYPIFYKIYHRNQPTAEVYRYLVGTSDVLDICGYGHHQTIYNRTLRHCDSFKIKNPYDQELAKLVVSGDDEDNIEQAHKAETHARYFDGRIDEQAIVPKFNKDLASQPFLHDLKCCNLKPMMSMQFGNTLAKAICKHIKPAFEVDKNTTLTMYESPAVRWALHRLLHLLDSSAYTDITMSVRFESPRKASGKCDLYSQYIGLCPETETNKAIRRELIEALRKWCVMYISPLTPVEVTLTKTWLEEVYIELVYHPDTTERFYFDLASYSLASMSFVDMLG